MKNQTLWLKCPNDSTIISGASDGIIVLDIILTYTINDDYFCHLLIKGGKIYSLPQANMIGCFIVYFILFYYYLSLSSILSNEVTVTDI